MDAITKHVGACEMPQHAARHVRQQEEDKEGREDWRVGGWGPCPGGILGIDIGRANVLAKSIGFPSTNRFDPGFGITLQEQVRRASNTERMSVKISTEIGTCHAG